MFIHSHVMLHFTHDWPLSSHYISKGVGELMVAAKLVNNAEALFSVSVLGCFKNMVVQYVGLHWRPAPSVNVKG